jgi:hypothetical protein
MGFNSVTDTACTKPNVLNGQTIACNHATYSDVGADASGAATSTVNSAVNGTNGNLAKFTGTHTVGDGPTYASSSFAGVVPLSDGSGTVNNFVTHASLDCMASGTNCPSATTLGAVPLSEWRIKGADLGAATTDISVNTASGWTLAVASSSFATGAYTDVYATTVFNGSCALGGTWVSICMAVNVDSSALIGGQGCTTVYAHGANFSLSTTGRYTPGAGAHNVNAYMKIGSYGGTPTGTGCSIAASAPLSTMQNATTQVFLRENN